MLVTGLMLASRIEPEAIRPRADSGSRACSRSVIAELVRVIQSTVPPFEPVDHLRRQGLGVGVAVDGDLLDLGDPRQLVLQQGPAAIGAGQQDPTAGTSGPRASASPSERNDSGTTSARRRNRPAPRPSPGRSRRASGGRAPGGRGRAASSRSRKCRTPLDEVKTSQSNVSIRAMAASSGPESSTGRIRTVGATRTSAPSASRSVADRSDSPSGRVTTTRPAEQRQSLEPGQRLASRDHVPDHEQGRRADPLAGRLDPVAAGRPACRRRSAGPPSSRSRPGRRASPRGLPSRIRMRTDRPMVAEAHVEDERAGEPGERRPVEPVARAARLVVAGDEGDGRGRLAVRDRQAGVRGRPDARRHPRHDAEGHPGGVEVLRLLGPPAEDIGIAPLEPDHGPAFAGVADEHRVDLVLRHRALAPPLAGEDELGPRPGPGRASGVDQVVIHDHVGPRQGLRPGPGQEAGVPRPGADEIDGPDRYAHGISNRRGIAAPSSPPVPIGAGLGPDSPG